MVRRQHNRPDTVVVVPTRGQFAAVAACCGSVVRNTPSAAVLLIDDASDDYPDADVNAATASFPDRFAACRFDAWGGLLRSWNLGLQMSRSAGFRYACLANSDVLFPAGWDGPLKRAVDAEGFALAGPLTNAPGTEARQHVHAVLPGLAVADAPAHVQSAQDRLLAKDLPASESTLNGFCLFARVDAWWARPYDREHVFRPENARNSKGQPNPTPLMTLGEYELQGRWHEAGLRSGVARSAYVFHYRSLSRGPGHLCGDWRPGPRGRHPWALW